MRNPLVRDLSIIAGAIVLLAALAFGFSATRTAVAPARAIIIMNDVRTPNLTSTTTVAARNRVSDEVVRAQSKAVFQAAADDLGIELAELRRTVSVRQDEDATAVVIDGKASTVAVSETRANAVAAAYEAAVRSSYENEVGRVLEQLETLVVADQGRVDELNAAIAAIDADLAAEASANAESAAQIASLTRTLTQNSTDRASLASEASGISNTIKSRKARIDEVNAELALFDGGIQFVNVADGASGPIEPQTKRNVALAAAAGLLIGLGIAWSFADAERDSMS